MTAIVKKSLCMMIAVLVICAALPVIPRAASSTVTGTSNETVVYEFLTGEAGLSNAAACGIMANIQKESFFKPALENSTGHYGICQWGGVRKTRLISWCKSNGYSYTSLSGQLHFLEYELINYYAKVYNMITSAPNSAEGAYQAGYDWCYYYEIPGSRATSSVTRGNLAKESYWPIYGNGGSLKESAVVSTPDTPVLASLVNTSSNTLKLTWNKVSGVDGYNIYAKKNGSFALIGTVSGASTTQYTYTKGSSGKVYRFTVSAYKNSVEGAYDENGLAIYKLDKVVITSAKALGSEIDLAWKEVGGASYYRIYRSVNGGAYVKVKDVTGLTYQDQDVQTGSSCSYKVRAFKNSYSGTAACVTLDN